MQVLINKGVPICSIFPGDLEAGWGRLEIRSRCFGQVPGAIQVTELA